MLSTEFADCVGCLMRFALEEQVRCIDDDHRRFRLGVFDGSHTGCTNQAVSFRLNVQNTDGDLAQFLLNITAEKISESFRQNLRSNRTDHLMEMCYPIG